MSSQGEAFQVVFHTPADAVGWCLSVQSLLLSAPWPSVLLEHARAAPQCMPSAPGLDSSTPWHVLMLVCARHNPSLHL